MTDHLGILDTYDATHLIVAQLSKQKSKIFIMN